MRISDWSSYVCSSDLGLVSIHASAQEATPASHDRQRIPDCFDPRLRAGGDGYGRQFIYFGFGFDPRLRAGGDTNRKTDMTKTPCFDPRLAGGDSRRTPRPSRRICFDPRLRAGGDLPVRVPRDVLSRSEEHTSELQSLMRIT